MGNNVIEERIEGLTTNTRRRPIQILRRLAVVDRVCCARLDLQGKRQMAGVAADLRSAGQPAAICRGLGARQMFKGEVDSWWLLVAWFVEDGGQRKGGRLIVRERGRSRAVWLGVQDRRVAVVRPRGGRAYGKEETGDVRGDRRVADLARRGETRARGREGEGLRFCGGEAAVV